MPSYFFFPFPHFLSKRLRFKSSRRNGSGGMKFHQSYRQVARLLLSPLPTLTVVVLAKFQAGPWNLCFHP